ncbi:diaminopimelate decarboxylase [Microbacterium sp. W4I20]|uniref:diaminopimelate decarboxylase n=1 Tax=Microbacterium sp. W4I20 TaxID=3042262 RepID=UPI0027856D12|nr:diaminopimelate decarboxylase [Microbacterium sp. W4I20]MDQ0728298.1 diaminopimelate decarboxylase [Microbacterium sp. W4I20]
MTNTAPVSAPIDLSLYPETATLDDGGRLTLGGVAVADVVERFGTPLYVVDVASLRIQARRYIDAFASRHARSTVMFASKSFPAPAVIRVLAAEGCGVDVASTGELVIARAAGAQPGRMVFHGNAKTDEDISSAIDAGVGHIVIDNLDDVDRIARLATSPVPALLRVSPHIAASTHSSLSTGHDSSKFGVPSGQVNDVIARIRRESMIDLQGIHAHIGSQILDLDQFEAEVRALSMIERFPVYDFGGGLGIRYVRSDAAPSVDDYADRMVGAMHRHLGEDVDLIVEPGRSMVGRSGITAYRISTVKRGVRTHVAVDGGMGDNLEVALYGQAFEPAVLGKEGRATTVDVVGRFCESGDQLVRDAPLVDPHVGDIITVPATGAYCYTLANNYNAALRPPVVFCDDGAARVVVRRETYDDLLQRDVDHAHR